MNYTILLTPLRVVEKELIKTGLPLALKWAKDESMKRDLASTFSDMYIECEKNGEEYSLEGHIHYYLNNAKLLGY